MTDVPNPGVHTVHEDFAWTESVGDHPERTDSPGYTRSRKLMVEIGKESGSFYGSPPWQDHHGGGAHVWDGTVWHLYMLPAGVEWSGQFACDPARIDLLRVAAKALVDAFPGTLPKYEEMGYSEGRSLLDTPITDADGIAAWTDSIFNASVPLPQGPHTGTLPKFAGIHHYPWPVSCLAYLVHADFQLWVTDDQGKPVAVAPVAPRGSGEAAVRVLYATPGTNLHDEHIKRQDGGEDHILPAHDPLAEQAFSAQH